MSIPASIKRNSYIERITPFMRKSLIKVMTGQRRVGKSHILFQLMEMICAEEPKANIIYINKEDIGLSFINSAETLHQYVAERIVPEGYNYIFIDEIQDIAEFEKALRSLLLNPFNDIYITGSNANMLSGELATYLSGRYVEFTIYSLSYPEFLHFHQLADSDKSYNLYIRYGGLPYLIHLRLEDEIAFEYLRSIYSTIVYRDVVNRYSIRNTAFLEKLIFFLADNMGNIFSSKSISDYLKSQNTPISPLQVISYADHVASAFIIHKVGRYDMVGKRVFEIGDKFYFENMGIRNCIVGYKPQDRAKILENVVYNHLVYKGYSVRVGVMNKQEIDFVCQRGGEKLYIQVALRLEDEATIKREFGNLLKIEDNYPKMLITQDAFEGNTYEGIECVQVRDFLMR